MRPIKMWKYYRQIAALCAFMTVTGFAYAKPNTINVEDYMFLPLQAKVVAEKDTLLLSDSPEYVQDNGILAAGTMNGKSRVYFYHVNENTENKHIGILLSNDGKEESHVTIHRKIAVDPSEDYFKVGRELSRKEMETSREDLVGWAKSGVDLPISSEDMKKAIVKEVKVRDKADEKQAKADAKAAKAKKDDAKNKKVDLLHVNRNEDMKFTLAPNDKREVFLDLNDHIIKKDQLFSGILDLSTTQPTQVAVMMLPEFVTAQTLASALPVLPIDHVELRGTYHGASRLLEVTEPFNSDRFASSLEIANDWEDPFITGVDELSNNKPVKDVGNYGVSNLLVMHTAGKTPFALYFNPMGGAYAGSIRVSQGSKSKIYDMPSKSLPYLGHQTMYDTMYLDTFKPGEDIVIEYMPAGASNLPVRFLFIPEPMLAARSQ